MNNDTIKGQFDQFIGAAKSQWGKLTDDDFMRVSGDLQKLKGAVQERYGITKEEAEQQVSKWESSRPRDMTDRSGH
ncbi:CsbD family protein [Aquidulcibacter sp.]|uniref:CsbD family protein n=1 Tax=Aquidulcibacter sp. TaxID=2052990 RepID=UPI0025BE4A7C|nr:CsbD family protein [Aquidulcibacter sp.]MCA3693200.1 CsbD family protein [Aquidulcibacter sp.]